MQEDTKKLKQEIQSEYLAAFQKTVAMHEVFLMRLATHPVLREDSNFQASNPGGGRREEEPGLTTFFIYVYRGDT